MNQPEPKLTAPGADLTKSVDPDATLPPSPPSDNPSAFTIERTPFALPGYQLQGVLGTGGMGVVYKAWQPALRRSVAIKTMLPGPNADAEDLARFRREAESAAQLQHPGIVQVY